MKHPRGHVVLLALGTMIYVLVVIYAAQLPSAAISRELLEIWAIKKIVISTAIYIAFASMVIAWALPRSLPGGISDARS